MRHFIALLLVLWLTACTQPDWPIPVGLPSAAAMQSAIHTLIPPSTSVTDAQERLQASGFECVYQWHGAWEGEPNINYLYCHRTEGSIGSGTTWQVAVILKGVTVGSIRVTSSTAGS